MKDRNELVKIFKEVTEGYNAEDAFYAFCDALLMNKSKKQIEYARDVDRRKVEDLVKIELWKKVDHAYSTDDFPEFVKEAILETNGLTADEVVYALYKNLYLAKNVLFYAEHDGKVYFDTQGYVNIVRAYSSAWLDIEVRERWFLECGLFSTKITNVAALL